ncbi:Cytosolic seryl-tRNA synthetase [Puttea exsequens]|nr:Cytosolic seryl-tRNA synthetase [Puttea exsequens]
MVLDIQDFIVERGGDPVKIKESQRRRHAPESVVDDIIAIFEDHRRTHYAGTQIGAYINKVQKEIGVKRKAKEDADELTARKAELEREKKVLMESAAEKDELLQRKLKTVGNYVHDSVPVSGTEDDNAEISKWAPEGVKVEKRDFLSHHEVLYRIDGFDQERGTKVAGHRGYCLIEDGLLLNLALVNYGLHFLRNKGYRLCQPPYFMLREAMAKTAQLEQFDEELYKVTEGKDTATDKYLIATSEQPISAMHAEEWMQPTDLATPLKYAGYSTNFRKEAGAHGKESWGTFRVHQFEKIEQFLFTKPEDSWAAFDAMFAISEEFYQSLQLPYRVVAIVSGALNNAAAKKYDLEAWFPYQGEYKELVSCSNCTDYQCRALEIRYGVKKEIDSRKTYVHALNSTLCATERTLCCVLENYQTEEGVRVPEVLRPFMPGNPEFLPFVKELPKDSTSLKAEGKPKKGKVEGAVEKVTEKIKELRS